MLIFSLALMASSVSAAIVVSETTLGDSNAVPGDTDSSTFTITNTGASTVTGIVVSSTASSGYAITFTGAPTSLAAAAVATVTVNGKIADNHDAVNSALDDGAFSVGSIVATGSDGNSTISGSGDLKVQMENHLEIKDIFVTVNGDEEHSLDDGDEVDDLKPGDSIDIRVVVENTYNNNDDEDIDLEDITINVVLDDSDFDIDEDEDLGDLSAEDEDSVTFSNIEIEDDASGSYTVKISVEGRGEGSFSGRHGATAEFDLNVDRESHEITINGASLSPSRLACDKNTFDVKMKLKNIGKSDEDEVAIEVAIPSLGVNVMKEDISIDESDESSRTIPVLLGTNVKPGTYSVELTSFWNNDIESDQATLSLIVDPCAVVTPAPTTPVVTTPTTTAPTTTTTTSTTSVRAKSADSFLESPAGIATLSVGILAAIVIIVLLIAMMVKPGKSDK